MTLVGEIKDILLFWTEEKRQQRAERRADRAEDRADAGESRTVHKELRQLLDEQVHDVEELFANESDLDRRRNYENDLRRLRHRRALMLEAQIQAHPAFEEAVKPLKEVSHGFGFMPLTADRGLQLRPPELRNAESGPNMKAASRLEDVALSLKSAGQKQTALLVLSEAIDIVPDFAHFLHIRAGIKADLGEWEGVKDDLERAVELDPEHPSSYNLLGFAYGNLDEDEAALDAWQHAAQLNPQESTIRVNMSIALLRLERFPEALDEIDAAIELAPEEMEFRIRKAHIFEAMGEEQQARLTIQEVLRQDPGNAHAAYHDADGHFKAGEWEKAVTALDQVVADGSGADYHWNIIGICLDHLGRQDEALEAYTRAIELDPADTLYRLNRASLLVKMGQDTDAEVDFSWLLQELHASDFRQKYATDARLHPYFEPLRSHERFGKEFQRLLGPDGPP